LLRGAEHLGLSGERQGRTSEGSVTLVGPDAALLLGAGHDTSVISRLGGAVRGADPGAAVVAALGASAGAAAVAGYVHSDPANARALVQGSAWVTVTSEDGRTVRFDGQGAGVRELSLVRPIEVVLGCPGPAGEVRVVFLLGPEPVQPAAEHGTQSFVEPEPEPEPTPAPVAPTPIEVPSFDPPTRLDAPAVGEFDFAHLVESTQYLGVEAAAVRETAAVSPEDDLEAVRDAEISWGSPPATPAPAPGLVEPPATAAWTPPPLVGVPSVPPAPSPPVPSPPIAELSASWAAPEPLASPAPPATPDPESATPEAASGSTVQAVSCPVGHLNPPAVAACRACGSAIVDRSVVWAPRPVLGVLRFDGGRTVDVDRSLLIGRRPSATDRTSDFGLVEVNDPESSVSRSHVEVTVEEWQITMTDLGSTNGTVVEAPGEDPVRLRAHEPHVVGLGVRVILGGAVTFDLAPAGA